MAAGDQMSKSLTRVIWRVGCLVRYVRLWMFRCRYSSLQTNGCERFSEFRRRVAPLNGNEFFRLSTTPRCRRTCVFEMSRNSEPDGQSKTYVHIIHISVNTRHCVRTATDHFIKHSRNAPYAEHTRAQRTLTTSAAQR